MFSDKYVISLDLVYFLQKGPSIFIKNQDRAKFFYAEIFLAPPPSLILSCISPSTPRPVQSRVKLTDAKRDESWTKKENGRHAILAEFPVCTPHPRLFRQRGEDKVASFSPSLGRAIGRVITNRGFRKIAQVHLHRVSHLSPISLPNPAGRTPIDVSL